MIPGSLEEFSLISTDWINWWDPSFEKFNKGFFWGGVGREVVYRTRKGTKSTKLVLFIWRGRPNIVNLFSGFKKSYLATQKKCDVTRAHWCISFFFSSFINGIRPFLLLSLIIPGAPRKAYLSQLCNPQKQSSWLTPNGSVWRRRWHKAALPAPYPSGWVAAVVDVCVGKVFFFSLFSFFHAYLTLCRDPSGCFANDHGIPRAFPLSLTEFDAFFAMRSDFILRCPTNHMLWIWKK